MVCKRWQPLAWFTLSLVQGIVWLEWHWHAYVWMTKKPDGICSTSPEKLESLGSCWALHESTMYLWQYQWDQTTEYDGNRSLWPVWEVGFDSGSRASYLWCRLHQRSLTEQRSCEISSSRQSRWMNDIISVRVMWAQWRSKVREGHRRMQIYIFFVIRSLDAMFLTIMIMSNWWSRVGIRVNGHPLCYVQRQLRV